MMTASFRATATAARLKPSRSRSLSPQFLRLLSFLAPVLVRITVAASAISRFLHCGHFSQRLGTFFPETGVAGQPALRFGGLDACFGSLGDQRAFELRHGAKHLQGKQALRRGCVDGIPQ